MSEENKPIIPIFSGERMHGETIDGYHTYDEMDDAHYIILKETPQTHHEIKPETIRMSLDNGREWHTMERMQKLIEWGLQYEYAIESLAKENDDEQ